MRRLGLVMMLISGALPLEAGMEAVGTSAAPAMRLCPDARLQALSGSEAAPDTAAGALAFNPAGLGGFHGLVLQGAHLAWFEYARMESLSLGLGAGADLGLAAGMRWIGMPLQAKTVERPNGLAEDEGSFMPTEREISFGAGTRLFKHSRIGLSAHYAEQSVDDQQSTGLGADLGLMQDLGSPDHRLGFSYQGLGMGLSEGYRFPALWRFGGQTRFWQRRACLLGSVEFPQDAGPSLLVSGEGDLAELLYPRAGWRFDGVHHRFSAGLGLSLAGLVQVDLATTWLEPLGTVWQAGMSLAIGREPKWGFSFENAASPVSVSAQAASLRGVQAVFNNQVFGASAQFEPQAPEPEAIRQWRLDVYDTARPPQKVRTLSGQGPVPKVLRWDGKDQNGLPVPQGQYQAAVSMRHANGIVLSSPYLSTEVVQQVPQLSMQLSEFSGSTSQAQVLYMPAEFVVQATPTRLPCKIRLEIWQQDGAHFDTLESPLEAITHIVWKGQRKIGADFVSNTRYTFQLNLCDQAGHLIKKYPSQEYLCVFRH
jgi:hypothetical protein